MPRIPYDQIAPEANKLFIRMATATDINTLQYWHDAYASLLEAAGWDPVSFDNETQKRVDEGWDDSKPIIWN